MNTIRSLTKADISEILRVQQACYRSELIESAESFLNKLRIWGKGCIGAWDGNRLSGYIIAHPWKYGQVVPLDQDSYEIPGNADCMYIHDAAVDPGYRRHRIAQELLARISKTTRTTGLNRFALVAVQNSETYWSRWGFAVHHTFRYHPNVPASYMVCQGWPTGKPRGRINVTAGSPFQSI